MPVESGSNALSKKLCASESSVEWTSSRQTVKSALTDCGHRYAPEADGSCQIGINPSSWKR